MIVKCKKKEIIEIVAIIKQKLLSNFIWLSTKFNKQNKIYNIPLKIIILIKWSNDVIFGLNKINTKVVNIELIKK